jgi:DNA-binding transcriptional ArsR family regulator
MSRRNKHAVFCETFLDRIVSERRVSGNAFAVAYVLARHFNAKTKLAWPGQERICVLTGLSEAAVKRAIKELEDAGYIEKWVSYGRGKANTYRPIPAEKGSFLNPFNRRNRTYKAPHATTERHLKNL